MSLSTITTQLIRHTDGRPVGYIDATAIAVFAYQQPDGSYVIDICTRQHIPAGQLSLLLDGAALAAAHGEPADTTRPAGSSPKRSTSP